MRAPLINDDGVRTWIEAFLREHLDLPDRDTFDVTRPTLGRRTPIAIVKCGSGPQVVVRLVDDKPAYLRTVFQQRRLYARGLPVPAILATTLRGPARHAVIVEEFAPGTPVHHVEGADRPAALLRVAEALAALHSVRRGWRGWMFLALPGSHAHWNLRRAESRFEALDGVVDAARLAGLRKAMTAAAERIGRRDRHELIHGHVNPSNFVVLPDRAVIIDLGVVQYGDAAQDIVPGLQRLCFDEPDAKAAFLQRYFECVEGFDRDEYERQEPFYHADLHLARAAGMLRQFERGRVTEDEYRRRLELEMGSAIEAAGTLLTK